MRGCILMYVYFGLVVYLKFLCRPLDVFDSASDS